QVETKISETTKSLEKQLCKLFFLSGKINRGADSISKNFRIVIQKKKQLILGKFFRMLMTDVFENYVTQKALHIIRPDQRRHLERFSNEHQSQFITKEIHEISMHPSKDQYVINKIQQFVNHSTRKTNVPIWHHVLGET
ncbi:unnamed protein product, partial [Brassica rapa subsp. trilocularis]